MRVLILADEFFATRERTLLSRLEVGLADEGVRVVHAVPDTLRDDAPGGVYSQVVRYSPRTLGLARSLAARRLTTAVAELDRDDMGAPIDVVHVFGGSAWNLGMDFGDTAGAGVALEIWRAGLVERARSLKPSSRAPMLVVPDPAIERALLAGGEDVIVRNAPWGVLTSSQVRDVLQPDRAVSVMLVGSGRDAPAFVAAIEGLAVLVRRHPQVLVFCDALAARRAELWPLARRLGLLSHFTLIEDLETRRDLLLSGDILIQPDAHGEQRSIVLEAFGAGMVVVALADPMVTALRDGSTARLVMTPEMEGWAGVLLDVLDDPARARGLALAAHDFVREQRKASDHVRAVLAAYALLAGDQAGPVR